MKKSDLTKSRIIQAAEDMFMQGPVSKISMSTIAQAIGISKGTIYLYFESKEDLVWAVTEKYLMQFIEILGQMGDLPPNFESIDRLIDALFDYILDHEKEMKMLHRASFYGFLGKSRLENHFEPIFKKIILDWLQKGVDQEIFCIDHVAFYVDYINASVHTMIDSYIMEETPYDQEIIRTSLKAMIKKLLR